MPALTEATKQRQRLDRLKRMTPQERMLADYNKSLERGKNKQSFSAQDAEKTAEKISDNPEEEGFISDLYSQLSNVGESISSGIGMARDAWNQGFEWNPGKQDQSDNMKRIMAEHEAGGSTAVQNAAYPAPPPSAQAVPGESGGRFSDSGEKMDFTSRMGAHRERMAAQKNNVTNKQLQEMKKKSARAKYVEKVENLVREGKLDARGPEVQRMLGDGDPSSGKSARVKYEEKVIDLVRKGELANSPEVQRILGGQSPEQQKPGEDPYSSYPHGQGEFEKMEYETAMPPPPEEVGPETAVPKTTDLRLKNDAFEQDKASYDYDEENYEGIVRENVQSTSAESPMSEDEAKETAERGMFNLGREGDAPESSPEDDFEGQNAVREQSSKLNKTILDPNTPPEEKKQAKEVRKKIYAHLPPRERALAKEETGNYWIDPISGVAINIDAVEADGRRKSNWLMLDKLPEHARPYFMAKFGYLDAEDVDGMPIDPKLKIAEMNMQAKKLELESLEKRHTQSTDVQYAQITGKSELHASNLKWEREKYNNLSKAQQEELQIKQYNQIRSDVDLMFKNGQYESGMLLAQGLNIPYVMDPVGFWKSKAKVSTQDPVFTRALVGAQLENMDAKTAGTKYNDKKGFYWNKLNETVKSPGMGDVTYFQAKAKLHGYKLWDQLTDAERAKAGNPMAHNNSMRSKVFNDLLLNDPVFKHLHRNLNDARTAAALGDRGGGGGDDAPEVVPKKKKKKKEISKKLTKKSEKLLEKPDLAPQNLVEKIMAENTDDEGNPERSLWEVAFSGPQPKWLKDPKLFKEHTLKKYFKRGRTEFNQKMKRGVRRAGSGRGKVFGNISEARKYYKTHTKELHKLSDELRYYIESGK